MSKIQLVDSHCHLYDEEFKPEIQEVVARAKQAGVQAIYLPNIDKTSIDPMLELEKDFPEFCYPMMGIHPCYVKEDWQDQLEIVRDWLAIRKFAAIGEIGLDFHWDLTFKTQQEQVFAQQLKWALTYDLPVSIHSRKATQQCIEMVKQIGNGKIRGVFHCFGGNSKQAKQIIDMNMYLGIGGVVTFKKAGLDLLLKETGLARVVLETDAPYLAPVPFRGKRNEPAYLLPIAEKIAEVLCMSMEEVGFSTSRNAYDLFG